MSPLLNRILASAGGIVTAIFIIIGCEALTGCIHQHVFILLLAGYALGCLGGGMVATLIANRNFARPAIITGVVVMMGGIMNLMDIQHPLWFAVVSQFMYIPFAYLGYLLARKR